MQLNNVCSRRREAFTANQTMIRLLGKLFGPKRVEATLGILDLSDGAASAEIGIDHTALAPLFTRVITSTQRPPSCGVLFLYCTFDTDGRIPGFELGLREIIRDSGATVVVVATANSGDHCLAAAKPAGYGDANLVLTLDRMGTAFATFFEALFSQMKRGTSMPVALVTLAPQDLQAQEKLSLPQTIFLCEAGQVALA